MGLQDLNKKLCPRTGQPCQDAGQQAANGSAVDSGCGLSVKTKSADWYRPASLQELGTLVNKCKENSVRLVFGNTSAGECQNAPCTSLELFARKPVMIQ